MTIRETSGRAGLIAQRLAMLLLLVAGFAAPAAATDYYACQCATGADAQCVNGNDGAAGTSPATAWRSYDRAQDAFAALAAGDTLSFCRGGVFPISGSNQWVNLNCRANQPCIVGAYTASWASGDEGRPVIQQTTGHAFALANFGDAEHEEGYVLRDLDIACTACGAGDWGIFLYNDTDDVRLQRLRIHGFSIGVHLAGSNPCGPDPLCDGRSNRLSLTDSEITDNFDIGFLGASDDLLIADNRFLRNGSGSVFQHNVYLSQGPSARARVLRNELYRSAASTTGSCQGGTFAVHGQHTDLLIEGNYLHEDLGAAEQTCWGIGMTPAYDTPESFVRAIIRGNTLRNLGNVAIAIGSCLDCVVENNLIVHEQAFGVVGVLAPAVARNADDAVMTRLTVRNNSFYTTAPGSSGVRLGGEGSGHVVVSNALQSTAGSGSFACLSLNLPVASYATVNHNVCGFVAGAGREWEEGSGSLSAWRSSSGFDVNSLAASPGYAAPASPTYDLRALSAASPMVGLGHPTASSPTEFYGNARGADPDAGAYQIGVEASLFKDGFEI